MTHSIPEFSAQQFLSEGVAAKVFKDKKPVIIRDLAQHWPLVEKAKKNPITAADYLIANDSHTPSYSIVGHPNIDGRFFYSEDLTRNNFQSFDLAPTAVLEQLIKFSDAPANQAHALSMQAGNIKTSFPDLIDEFKLSILDHTIEPNIWISNRSRVAAHFDLNDNIACVGVGSRTFTLFPPEQANNLYLGPMLNSPGGVPTSLVDIKHPDYDAFPNFKVALDNSLSATLEAGDAIYIPSPWWHAVESLEAINVLVNFWWNDHISEATPTANHALMLAILAISDMDQAQKDSWQSLFNYLVFKQPGDDDNYLPESLDDILNNPSKKTQQACVNFLSDQLNELKKEPES